MRGLILCIAIMFPIIAHAESGDTIIIVDYVIRQMRVRPSPMIKHGRSTVKIVLHSNGTVDDTHHGHGPHAKPGANRGKRLGSDMYKVVNAHTIKRVAHTGDLTRTLTISVNGASCTASVELALKSGKTEYKGYSTELGVAAYYTNPTLESADCTIR